MWDQIKLITMKQNEEERHKRNERISKTQGLGTFAFMDLFFHALPHKTYTLCEYNYTLYTFYNIHTLYEYDDVIDIKMTIYKYQASQLALIVKNLPANAGDAGPIPGLDRSPGGGRSNPLQHSCFENPMDRGAPQAIVHRVTKRYNLSDLAFTQYSTYKYYLLEKNFYLIFSSYFKRS